MPERLEAIVRGRVQVVMYRDFTCRNARSLGLLGFVENLRDGTVRVVAEGTREKLDAFLARLHRGSFLSNVREVAASWKDATGEFIRFSIRYD